MGCGSVATTGRLHPLRQRSLVPLPFPSLHRGITDARSSLLDAGARTQVSVLGSVHEDWGDRVDVVADEIPGAAAISWRSRVELKPAFRVLLGRFQTAVCGMGTNHEHDVAFV